MGIKTISSVAELMETDHIRLEAMLIKLNSSESMSYEDFKQFKWELEKHMFIEEKAIFSMLRDKSMDDSSQTISLLKEHDQLLKMLGALEILVRRRKRVKFDGLMEILARHKNKEDEFFYPRLDQTLPEKERKAICKRIEEGRKRISAVH